MLPDSLPRDVQDLVRSQLESYEHLAILLLAYRERTRDWSGAELAETLRIPAQLAESAVSGLLAAGLLRADSGAAPLRYTYDACGETDGTIGRLALEYANNPARVVKDTVPAGRACCFGQARVS